VESGTPFDFQLGHHTPTLDDAAAWGWLRAAYLAAFSVYGYRHARLAELDPIRQSLANPQHIAVPQLVVATSIPTGHPTPGMHLVHQPQELRGLLVDLGLVRVRLPAAQFRRSIAALEQGLSQVLAAAVIQVASETISWPGGPRFELDL
jgi:hypothetical protein